VRGFGSVGWRITLFWFANYEPFDFLAHPRNVREKRAEGRGVSYDSPTIQFDGGTISIQRVL